MADRKKYNIITTIEPDAPTTSGINWCTISFLTPQNIEKTRYLDAKGFKVHDGYNTEELAKDDAKKIKERNKNHDVYLSQIGKIYSWDDATKTDEVSYEDAKLNALEKTRREESDKIKLMKEQFKNEFKTMYADTDKAKADERRKKYQKLLYDKGLISKQEYDLMMEENKPSGEIKDIVASLEKIKDEIDEAYKTDYLDENEPTGLKYGCMSIYSPKHIGGLKTLLFKVRGLFQTQAELVKRIKRLQSLYPNDRIYQFEVGKWCVFSEKDGIEPTILLKQLNYGMKCYRENLENQAEEFEKRKEKLKTDTEQAAKVVKMKNRRQKRREKLEAEKQKNEAPSENPSENAAEPPVESADVLMAGDSTDNAIIQKMIDLLDDPELRNKYPASETSTQTVDLSR